MLTDIRTWTGGSGEDSGGLLGAARAGDARAFRSLFDELAPMAWRMALVLTGETTGAADAVATGAGRAFGTSSASSAQIPDATVAMLRATWLAALDILHRDRRRGDGPTNARAEASEPPVTAETNLDAALVSFAFLTMPEQWRGALWLTEAEGLSSEIAGAVLDLVPSAFSQLLNDARAGFIECGPRLESGEPGGSSRPAKIGDVSSLLRPALSVVPPDLDAAAAERWQAALVSRTGWHRLMKSVTERATGEVPILRRSAVPFGVEIAPPDPFLDGPPEIDATAGTGPGWSSGDSAVARIRAIIAAMETPAAAVPPVAAVPQPEAAVPPPSPPQPAAPRVAVTSRLPVALPPQPAAASGPSPRPPAALQRPPVRRPTVTAVPAATVPSRSLPPSTPPAPSRTVQLKASRTYGPPAAALAGPTPIVSVPSEQDQPAPVRAERPRTSVPPVVPAKPAVLPPRAAVAKPAVPAKPVVLPPKPVVLPPRAVVLPPKPVVLPPKPVVLPPKPVMLPPRPVVLPPRPVVTAPAPTVSVASEQDAPTPVRAERPRTSVPPVVPAKPVAAAKPVAVPAKPAVPPKPVLPPKPVVPPEPTVALAAGTAPWVLGPSQENAGGAAGPVSLSKPSYTATSSATYVAFDPESDRAGLVYLPLTHIAVPLAVRRSVVGASAAVLCVGIVAAVAIGQGAFGSSGSTAPPAVATAPPPTLPVTTLPAPATSAPTTAVVKPPTQAKAKPVLAAKPPVKHAPKVAVASAPARPTITYPAPAPVVATPAKAAPKTKQVSGLTTTPQAKPVVVAPTSQSSSAPTTTPPPTTTTTTVGAAVTTPVATCGGLALGSLCL